MKGILADINSIGPVEDLVERMQAEPWTDFWTSLHLELKRFEDVGLTPESSDLEIWQCCQAEQLVLITDNRNHESPESLEATIRKYNRPDSLPVFTIGKLTRFRTNRTYAEKLLNSLFDYLLRIDEVRGTGRLYLP